MPKRNRSSSKRLYAEAVYQAALEKANKKIVATVRAELARARQFLLKQGIDLTLAQAVENVRR